MTASLTEDTLLGGAVRFIQPATGYRVNVDSVLLAAFATTGRAARRALDLGAGVGAVALLLHHHGAARELVLVEREPRLAELARQNLAAAGAPGRVLELDLAERGLPRDLANQVELVVSNPPFFSEGHHRPPATAARRSARLGGLAPFLTATARALSGPKARAAFVYPARAVPELLAAAHAVGLVPKRLRLVHAYADRPARLALLELRRARQGGLVIDPPLVEWSRPGRRSPELVALTGAGAGRR